MRYPFELPALPYDYSALDAAIDAQTMEIHHGKHHQGYTNKLNAALEGHPELHDKSILELLARLDEIPEEVRTAVRNNGGGYFNHALFWPTLSPSGGGQPEGALGAAIDTTFGSFDAFTSAFSSAAGTVFGSGWAWLVSDAAGTLSVQKTTNQDTPLAGGYKPLLGLDVWEHAYYLRYQNRRGDYISAFWDVVDWKNVGAQYGG
ncbi:MAG: superoxide dismutase [Acidobacteriota bacterium]